ncbi:MAG: gliding motility-associated C-terminal domain-containing protein [Candidatus Latescibacterota bacterium]|nr:gliding motility-associated C-terminal domain-containing protein [Candidatus Latescibacterota bacterium]
MSWLWVAVLLLPGGLFGQPAQTYVLGDRGTSAWTVGGDGVKPEIVLNVTQGLIELTNTPGQTIDFVYRPGWIGPLRFDEEVNIAARVLDFGSIKSPNSGRGHALQLEGTVNGDHEVAFERKPTIFEPRVATRGIWVILDFMVPIGVQRVLFYPRNTVVETPATPFHNDFLRGYELWLNEFPSGQPDVLVQRELRNEEPVVDVAVPPQYTRFVKIKSLADVPFEIDEVEVYGTGFLQQGRYLSNIIDLGDRATVGFVEWVEDIVGHPDFSDLEVRVRTGSDDTPLIYLEKIPIGEGVFEFEEVTRERYADELLPIERGGIREDTEYWSPWFRVRMEELLRAPTPRRHIQFSFEFEGGLFTTRQVDELRFDYLQPPIADGLRAEVFPRLAKAEEPATFRYAVRLRSDGEIRGFDRLEVDTNIPVMAVREVVLDGVPIDFAVDFIREEGFSISFPLVRHDEAVLEFTFDLPIFRFGTTFSGRAYNIRSGEVPQRLEPDEATDFGPGDFAELSNLSVAIPKPQIGKLVGEIAFGLRVFTPNGDGINDELDVFFNVLQLTRSALVRLALFDLAGREVYEVFGEERGVGPVEVRWDGRLEDGRMVLPGSYIWVLRVRSDAFEEVHSGTLGVAY